MSVSVMEITNVVRNLLDKVSYSNEYMEENKNINYDDPDAHERSYLSEKVENETNSLESCKNSTINEIQNERGEADLASDIRTLGSELLDVNVNNSCSIFNSLPLPEVSDVITHLVNSVENPIASEKSSVTGESASEPDDNDVLSENDSPIKMKKKKIRALLDEMEDSPVIRTEVSDSSEDHQNLKLSSVKQKKKSFQNLFDEMEGETGSLNDSGKETEALSDVYDSERKAESLNEEKDCTLNGIFDNELNEDESNLIENEGDDVDSNLHFEASFPINGETRKSRREAKGKDLMKQALSLPYFQLPKPDFKQYMDETDKRLEKPLLGISNNPANDWKLLKRKTLKPVDNNIVFEIDSYLLDKVEPFRKKVLNMMNLTKFGTSGKGTVGSKKNGDAPIGAERLSWKTKLLSDIAKKKEAVLKERNEMLEEVMEDNDEENHIDSESEEDDDAVDVHFTDANSAILSNEISNIDPISQDFKDTHLNNSCTMFTNTFNKDCEVEKDFTSSQLCFSLPSFQPDGGFSKTENIPSSSLFSASQEDLSFNENVQEKNYKEISRNDTSELKIPFTFSSGCEEDEKVYDKVLAEEKLLANQRTMPSDIITSDVLDMCSGQFLDTVENPKTPPLPNILVDEESDIDVSDEDCPSDHPLEAESDSDSDDDLTFERKVLKKRIRPISPIDEESRHGEGDIQVNPSAMLIETSSNFNFSKDMLPSMTKNDSDSEIDDDQYMNNNSTLNYNSEESLIDDDHTKKIEIKKTARDYFEDEAELSGEEGSSDEDEGEMDSEDALEIDDTELPDNELRDQIGTLHLKHLLDDDDQMIRQVKNHFLDEGELYSDAARQRKFNWSFNMSETVNNPDLSGSDNEEEINDSPFQQDKLKWKQETANVEITDEVKETQILETSFKVELQRKISSQIVAQRATHTINKRPRNSFLDEDDPKKSFKKIKLDVLSGHGTRATKNFVFVEASGPAKNKVSKQKLSMDNSVFDII